MKRKPTVNTFTVEETNDGFVIKYKKCRKLDDKNFKKISAIMPLELLKKVDALLLNKSNYMSRTAWMIELMERELTNLKL